MAEECEHTKSRITLDSGEEVCIICDDITTFMIDEVNELED